jgi:hypothetical protein
MPFLVPDVLLLAVPFDGGRVLLAIPPPIIRVAGAPFLRTIQADLAILRVCGDLLAVIIGAPAALAFRLAAHQLARLILRCQEGLFTVGASPFDHTGGCRIPRYLIARREI